MSNAVKGRGAGRTVGGVLLSSALVLGLAACGDDGSGGSSSSGGDGEPITIGAILSLSGAGAGLGIPARQGIELALDEVAEDGGVCSGRPLDVRFEDDASNPETASAKGDDLVNGEGAVALIGSNVTAATDAIAARTGAGTIPQLSFTGLGPPVELDYPHLYHILPPQELNAKAMLAYASEELGATRIGVLHDSGYGKVVTDQVKKFADDYGVELVAVEEDEVGATNVTSQAAKIRAADPDAVFVVSTNATYFRNAREAGITAPIVAAIGIASYEYTEAMGDAADDIVIPEFVVAEDPLERQTDFVEKFEAANGHLPKNFEAAGYDAVMMLVRALESTDCSTDPDELGSALEEPYDGVMASYDFSAEDKTGIALDSYVFSRLEDGQFTRLDFTVDS